MELHSAVTPAGNPHPFPIERISLEDPKISLSIDEIHNPIDFLRSADGMKVIKHILRDTYYAAWEPAYRPLSSKTCTEIAAKTIANLRAATTDTEREYAALNAISDTVRCTTADIEFWESKAYSYAQEFIEAVGLDIHKLGSACDFNQQEWLDALCEVCIGAMENQDKSSPNNVISSCDRAEIVFHIKPPNHSLDDMCSVVGPFLETQKVRIDNALSHGLSVLGHSIADFRSAFGNDMPDEPGLVHHKPRTEAIIDLQQIEELIENACSTHFQWVAYAQVSLSQLFKLDLSKPIAFNRVAIAAYNLGAGTFQDVRIQKEFIVQDGIDGSLEATDYGYSPDSICGLVGSCYHADLRNVE